MIGWTGDVNLTGSAGHIWEALSSLICNPLVNPNTIVLGLGGEYTAGTMFAQFKITDAQFPVMLYKAGMNSKLDLRQCPMPNTYTGGTIIAGGELIVNNAAQLNAHQIGNGGPIAILNGGRLHIMNGPNLNFWKSIMVNTDGTPDLVKNCGSVIEVDAGITATLNANFDFSWAPTTYLEKDGAGTLTYAAAAPIVAGPGQNPANAWGLKLTSGIGQDKPVAGQSQLR